MEQDLIYFVAELNEMDNADAEAKATPTAMMFNSRRGGSNSQTGSRGQGSAMNRQLFYFDGRTRRTGPGRTKQPCKQAGSVHFQTAFARTFGELTWVGEVQCDDRFSVS